MRIILLAPYASLVAKEDALVLEARGYDVATWFDLHQPSYRLNRNMPASEYHVRQNLTIELLEGAVPVLHTEVPPSTMALVAALCTIHGKPVLAMDDLDTCAVSMNGERIDAANILDTLPCALAELLAAAKTAEQPRRGTVPPRPYKGDALPPRDARPGDRVEMPVKKASFWTKLRHAEARVNRWLGDGLKNPQTRGQRHIYTYTLDTSPPPVTG